MKSIKTTRRETILEVGKFLRVEQHAVEFPGGAAVADWPWLVMPDYANVVVQTAGGAFLFFRQMKYAVDGIVLAPVGGYLEPGEDPMNAARRELLEETGCVAARWDHLGSYVVDGNRGGGTAHLFFAREAKRVQAIHADDLETQELIELTRAGLEEAFDNGNFKVLGWGAAVGLALLKLSREESAKSG